MCLAVAVGFFPTWGLAEGEIKGYMINEYYSVFSHHNRDLEGRHGFWLRRIYFTYNDTITDSVKMRLRLEMNSPGDFKTSSTLNAYVKDAYLNFKLSGQDVKVGIISPPTFDKIESVWGYRSLEKTPLDLYKLRSSRDFGIGMKGSLDSGKTVNYFIMYGNGSSNKAETNKGKIFYGALGFAPADGVYLELYGDYESQPNDKKYYVYQGFASYSGDWGRFGLQFSNKHYDQGDTSLCYRVLSAFVVANAADKLEIIARYDKNMGDGFEQSFNGSKMAYVPMASNVTSNFIIAALSYQATKNVWIIPNIKAAFYDDPDEGDKPGSDVYGNLTIWFKF